MSECDVLVVGAGPAGAVAAIVLARAGVRVRLIDRAAFPRDKLCGDTINPGTLALLRRLGLAPAIAERARPIDGMIVTGEGGIAVEGRYPREQRGLAISRRDFDAMLIWTARRQRLSSIDEQVEHDLPQFCGVAQDWREIGIVSAR